MSPLPLAQVLLAQGLLAQDTPVTDGTEEAPTIEIGEPSRPLTELLEGWFGDGPVVQLVGASIDVVAQVLLILVITWVVLFFVRRGIDGAVARAKNPDAPSGRRLRGRMKLLDESAGGYSLRRAQRADALGALAGSIVRVVVWTVAVLTILGTAFGISLGPFIAGAGILGIAIGFGAQDLVKDFLSGLFMLAEDQYGVGDIVDVGDAAGVVEGITLRTTRIRDVTGTLWHVPNGEISRVGNMSQEWARALLDIGVAYGTDIDAASELIQRVASEMAQEEDYQETFLDDPEIWGVENLGDDSVDIRLVIKTEPGKQYAIARELRRRIKNAFDAAEVEIPFPQRTVWLRTERPVSFGGEQARPFEHPVPDEPAMQRAVEAARRGDVDPPPGDLDAMLPDEPVDRADDDGDDQL
jgi:moderate conductance mechanosensitive channel